MNIFIWCMTNVHAMLILTFLISSSAWGQPLNEIYKVPTFFSYILMGYWSKNTLNIQETVTVRFVNLCCFSVDHVKGSRKCQWHWLIHWHAILPQLAVDSVTAPHSTTTNRWVRLEAKMTRKLWRFRYDARHVMEPNRYLTTTVRLFKQPFIISSWPLSTQQLKTGSFKIFYIMSTDTGDWKKNLRCRFVSFTTV